MDKAAAERKAHLEQLTLAIGQLVKNGPNPHHETDDAAKIAQLENLVIMLAQLVQNNDNDDGRDVTSKILEMRPDSYGGTEDPIELENWISQFEKIFTEVNCPDDQKVHAASYYFKGEADDWWYFNNDVFLARESFDWEALKAALRARFIPYRVKLQKCKELMALKQGGMSVAEYYNKFAELSRLVANLLPDEAVKVCSFVSGLNFSIQRYVFAGDYATVHEAYEKAGMIGRIGEKERMEGKKRKAYGGGESSRGQSQGSETMFRDRGNNQNYWGPERHYYCRRCQQDHPGVDCQGMAVDCHFCGELGHRAYECQMNSEFSLQNNQHGDDKPMW